MFLQLALGIVFTTFIIVLAIHCIHSKSCPTDWVDNILIPTRFSVETIEKLGWVFHQRKHEMKLLTPWQPSLWCTQ